MENVMCMYPGCNIYTRYNTICYTSIFFSSLEFWAGGKNGQGGGEEAVGSRRPTAMAKRTFSSSLFARFRQSVRERFERVVPLCFTWARWPPTVLLLPLNSWGSGLRILLHSWFLWEAVGLCITLTFLFGLRIPKKVRWSMHLNHFSLPLPLTTTSYLRQNCRSSPPHLYSSVIA